MEDEYDEIENDIYSDSEDALEGLSPWEKGFMLGYKKDAGLI